MTSFVLSYLAWTLMNDDRHVARVSEDSKITIDTEEYVNSFTASMMEATFAWSNGSNFSHVRANCFAMLIIHTSLTCERNNDRMPCGEIGIDIKCSSKKYDRLP